MDKHTVLVVDDEPVVRNLVCTVLASRGLEPIGAADGIEALRALEARRPAIGLVISDVRMPGITGIELAHLLRNEQPDLPVLLISGHLPDGPAALSFPFLPKPFSPAALLEHFRRLLPPR